MKFALGSRLGELLQQSFAEIKWGDKFKTTRKICEEFLLKQYFVNWFVYTDLQFVAFNRKII